MISSGSLTSVAPEGKVGLPIVVSPTPPRSPQHRLSNDEALAAIDRSMVRIRRNQSRRAIGGLMERRLGERLDEGVIFAVDAIDALRDTGAAATVGAVAELLGVDPSRASRLVADAVRTGYVQRNASAEDGRSAVLSLTDAAVAAAEIARRFRTGVFGEAMADWSDADREMFARLLQRFSTSVEALTAPNFRN